MPPLNQEHAFIERSGEFYVVKVTECNIGPNNNDSTSVAIHYLKELAGALKIAETVFSDNPLFYYGATGMITLEEPHDEDETYMQASVRSVGVFEDTST